MKKISLVITTLLALNVMYAQVIKNPLPKPAVIKWNFAQLIDDAPWKGMRTWQSSNSATTDVITNISFFAGSGQATWSKQGWEYITPRPGTYTITGDKIIIRFDYPPYKHVLEGVYSPLSKKITGTFREERSAATGAPPAYTPGIVTGTFELSMK